MMEREHPSGVDIAMAAVREATKTHFELTRNAAMGECAKPCMLIVMDPGDLGYSETKLMNSSVMYE